MDCREPRPAPFRAKANGRSCRPSHALVPASSPAPQVTILRAAGGERRSAGQSLRSPRRVSGPAATQKSLVNSRASGVRGLTLPTHRGDRRRRARPAERPPSGEQRVARRLRLHGWGGSESPRAPGQRRGARAILAPPEASGRRPTSVPHARCGEDPCPPRVLLERPGRGTDPGPSCPLGLPCPPPGSEDPSPGSRGPEVSGEPRGAGPLWRGGACPPFWCLCSPKAFAFSETP